MGLPSNMSMTPQIAGNLGLYYCCYKLSLLGWKVMPTHGGLDAQTKGEGSDLSAGQPGEQQCKTQS